jgi:hypothetical protein
MAATNGRRRYKGHAVTQWLRNCTTNRKVAGSIADGVIGFFIDIILGVKAAGA